MFPPGLTSISRALFRSWHILTSNLFRILKFPLPTFVLHIAHPLTTRIESLSSSSLSAPEARSIGRPPVTAISGNYMLMFWLSLTSSPLSSVLITWTFSNTTASNLPNCLGGDNTWKNSSLAFWWMASSNSEIHLQTQNLKPLSRTTFYRITHKQHGNTF